MPQLSTMFLTPKPMDAPESSLVSMFGFWAAEFGGEFVWLDWQRVLAALAQKPVALLGTALAFANLFEWMGERRVTALPGSYALETGGFKGSSREITKGDLYAQFSERLGIAPADIINEYGMCELSSQFYTRGLGAVHQSGPWVRALVISPETGREVAVGETGILRIFDLANLGSSLAIQTGDLAIRRERGFELLGRSPLETPRGCSRMADELIRAHAARIAMKSNTAARIAALPQPDAIRRWLTAELGHPEALDRFVPYAGRLARAVAPGTILHILSGNTPEAALQSLTRGLILGSRNLCKLPSSGLNEVEAFIAALPAEMRALIDTSTALPEAWLDEADAIIVFGNDTTIHHFRAQARATQTFLGYGHRLSLGIIFDDPELVTAPAAARDASLFDQQGCLSPRVFYVRDNAPAYAARLAKEMAAYSQHTPRGPTTTAQLAAIHALRETISFRASNGEPCQIFTGDDWTVIFDTAPGFPAAPHPRVIFVKPLPADLDQELAQVRPHLSACAIHPATEKNADTATSLGATRICAIGKMQEPPLTWHQDGQPTLSPLVRWVDFEQEPDQS